MKKMIGNTHLWLFVAFCIFMVSCASIDRGCSSCWAENMGADWVVVELTEMDGTPYRCWELRNVALSSEEGSDGIYWKDTISGNLIHVSGSYDYVQVKGDSWDAAFTQINMTRNVCTTVRNRLYDPVINKYINRTK